jgi:hypothetical protein
VFQKIEKKKSKCAIRKPHAFLCVEADVCKCLRKRRAAQVSSDRIWEGKQEEGFQGNSLCIIAVSRNGGSTEEPLVLGWRECCNMYTKNL